jgi:homopolymeric O-antigen transport system permease protein
MFENLAELYRHRELLGVIAGRDIKVRYKQSLMGYLWAVFMPLLIVFSGVVVRYAYAIASGKPLSMADVLAVSVKAVPWAFLVSTIKLSCQSLIGNTNLVTKVYFPKEILPIAAALSQLFDFFIAVSAMVIVFIVFRVHLTVHVLWAIPLLITMLLLAVGIGLFVSAGSLFFRDVKYIVDTIVTFAIFFTPVLYEVKMLGPKGRWLLLNPAAPVLEGFASVIRGQVPSYGWLLYSFLFAVATVVCGYLVFKRVEPAFAESV